MSDKEKQAGSDITGSTTDLVDFSENDRLFVVSNRQPYQHEPSPAGDDVTVNCPVGGLTAGLDPLMQETGGTWIAWGDGDADEMVVDDGDRVQVPPENPAYTLKRVWLADEQVDGYYYGFSNQVLWPLCHSSLATVHSGQFYWEQYRQTNEQFANKIAEEVDDSSIIWLHDYHLAVAPWLVRRQVGAGPTILQFWHIPWPSWDIFRACPYGTEILRGLLGNDILGFHVERYVKNFLRCVEAGLDDATIDWRTGDISFRGSATHVEAIPMGVPVEKIQRKATQYETSDFKRFRERHNLRADSAIAVGVDRYDYTKGIPERIRALERLWTEYPEWRGDLTYVQKGTESRSRIPAYQRLQSEVDEEVERINDRFGTDDWQPIVQLSEYLSQEELYGLYRHADVAIVSPIRDGFNLVAAEFGAAQVESDGVLVLSRQTGAHDVFGEDAVSVSPYNIGTFADRLNKALTMPTDERQIRMENIRRKVANNDLRTWLMKNAEAIQAVDRPSNLVSSE